MTVHEHLTRIQRRALTVGGIAGALTLVGAFTVREQFFRSYLIGYLLWVGVALGSLGLLLLHHLVGGRWGFASRRVLEASARTFPALAILFIPLLLGIHGLYEWSRPEVVAADPLLQHKSLYLNSGFFTIRAGFYFVIWIGMALLWSRWSAAQDREGGREITTRIQNASGPGLLLFGLTSTFASIDWVMSLEPHWFSAVYGLLFMVGCALSTMAVVVIAGSTLRRHEPLAAVTSPSLFHDWANLLLAFVMLWSYMAFSQFLIIWSGNLPEETPWYLNRMAGGWQKEALFLILFHFALPFMLLLSRTFKRSSLLPRLAIGILAARVLDLHFMTAPGFFPKVFHFHWMDVTAPVAIGGVWVAVLAWQLGKMPLLPLGDWRFEGIEVQVQEEAHQHG